MKTDDRFYYGNKTTTLACSIEVENPSRVSAVFKDWIFKNQSLFASKDKRYKLEEGNSTLIIEKPSELIPLLLSNNWFTCCSVTCLKCSTNVLI